MFCEVWRKALTLSCLGQHCARVAHMGHHDCVAHNDGSHGGAAVIPVAARVGLQVALVRLCECFSCSDKDY